MRLKFLFFPIMLVVSLAIFFWYIWPEINNVKAANQEKLTSIQLLQDIRDKQTAIGLTAKQMKNDREDVMMVENYLPEKKMEERIIGGVGYLATDAGISLVNISLNDADVKTATNVEIPANNQADSQTASASKSNVQFSEAKISIVGEYGKIQMFIDQLQRMPLLNNIKSLTISNQLSKNVNADGKNVNSSDLLADMVVDFGYLPKHSILDAGKIAEFKPELNKTTIETLKQYISQKTAWISVSGSYNSDKGRSNPFLPQ